LPPPADMEPSALAAVLRDGGANTRASSPVKPRRNGTGLLSTQRRGGSWMAPLDNAAPPADLPVVKTMFRIGTGGRYTYE